MQDHHPRGFYASSWTSPRRSNSHLKEIVIRSCPRRTSLLSLMGGSAPASEALTGIEPCSRKSVDGGLFTQRTRTKEKDCPHETQYPPDAAPDCDHHPGRFVLPGKSIEARRRKSSGIRASFPGKWILILDWGAKHGWPTRIAHPELCSQPFGQFKRRFVR